MRASEDTWDTVLTLPGWWELLSGGHIQGKDPFLEANRIGDCCVETDEEEYLWTLRSGKTHRPSGPVSLCLPAAITLTCGQPLGAMHVLLELQAPLLHFLLIEAGGLLLPARIAH